MWFCVRLSHFAGKEFFAVTTGGRPLLLESPCLLQQFCRLCHFHMALRLPAVPDSWDCGRVGQTCTEYGPTCYVYAKRGFAACGRCQYYPDHGVAKAVGDLCCSCMHEVLSDCCKAGKVYIGGRLRPPRETSSCRLHEALCYHRCSGRGS